jgi:hypothetical protein
MVRAILAGQKSMTRRVINPQPEATATSCLGICTDSTDRKRIGCAAFGQVHLVDSYIRPKYLAGDILYVRETFCLGNVESGENPDGSDAPYIEPNDDGGIIPKQWAIDENVGVDGVKWKPSIFMPKEFARIHLRVTGVRAERLQDITVEDVMSEGLPCDNELNNPDPSTHTGIRAWNLEYARFLFHELWDKLNKKRGYGLDTNPWVWVYTFERSTREEAQA